MSDPNHRDLDAPTQFSPPAGQVGQAAAPPYVHPSVQASPEAMAYQIGMAARLQGRSLGLRKYAEPTPGAGPAMPPLEAPHQEGMTIGAQAVHYGQTPQQQAVAASQQPGSIVDGPAPFGGGVGSMSPDAPRQAAPTPAQLGILQNDVLHPDAQNDSSYIQGQGAQLAINQPNLAMKYGVIRNRQHIPPQALQANVGGAGTNGQIGNRPLQNTLRDLETLTHLQPSTGLPKTEAEAEEQASQHLSSASQNVGAHEEQESKLSDKEVQAIIEKMDDFDFDALRQRMERDVLNNPEQRRIIEERLAPMHVEDVIMMARVSQKVPIIPGKFELTFRSMDAGDDSAVKRLIAAEVQTVGNPGRYYLDRFSLMTLCAGCTHVNTTPLPDHLNAEGKWDDKLFSHKLNWLLTKNLHMIASIGVNHSWFETRVRKLFVAEKVKNG